MTAEHRRGAGRARHARLLERHPLARRAPCFPARPHSSWEFVPRATGAGAAGRNLDDIMSPARRRAQASGGFPIDAT
jgi:hypothetical protein